MAKPATKPPAAKAPGKGIANVKAIDEQLAARAQALSTQLSTDGLPRIKLDSKKGVFVTGDGMDLGASIRLVIVDVVLAHRFYKGIYNSNDIQPPDCAAIGRDVNEIAPWDDVPDKQNDICKTCAQNQFGTSLRGSGKACKESRDLAVLMETSDGFDDKLYALSVPPTGIKSFDTIARFIGRTYNATPIKCIVTATVEDRGEYSTMSFGEPEPNPDYATHAALLEEAAELLERKPDFTKRENPKAGNNKKPAAKAAPRAPQRR